MTDKKRYSIGEMASICDLNPKTLRYYDQIGLISPGYKNPENGYRYYTKEQAFTIYIVKKLQLLDFSLQEIKALISTQNQSRYEQEIGKKVDQVNEKINHLKKIQMEGLLLLEKLNHHKEFVDSFDQHVSPALNLNSKYMDVQIENIAERTVVSTRKVMQAYNNFEISIDRWFEIFTLAEKQGYTPKGSIILTYHTYAPMDQFFKPECELETMLPVDAPETDGNIKKYGNYAAATIHHYGSYETIIQSHLKLLRWIEENGYTINGKVSEEYLVSPFDLQADGNYLTKIIYPVTKL